MIATRTLFLMVMGLTGRENGRKATNCPGSVYRHPRKFHVVVVQNNGKEMYKKVCYMCKVAFLLITPLIPIVIFSPFSLPSPFGIKRFYILFEQTINTIEGFAFSPG